MGRDDSQIRRDPVTTLHLHQISNHHILGIDVLLLTVTDNQGLLREWTQLLFKDREDQLLILRNGTCKEHLRDQVLEGVHDLGALGLLIVREAAGDDDDGGEHNTQVQL